MRKKKGNLNFLQGRQWFKQESSASGEMFQHIEQEREIGRG